MKHLILTISLSLLMIATTQGQSEISGSRFTDLVTNPDSGTYVIEFYADWCGYCKLMKPKFDQLANEYNDLTFYRVNSDETTVDEIMGISGVPYYIIMKDGEAIDIVEGADEDRLTSLVSEASGQYKNAEVQMDQWASVEASYGWDYYTSPSFFYLNDGSKKEYWITLEPGEEVDFYACGDSDTNDIDMHIYDEYDDCIEHDIESDATPMINYTNYSNYDKRLKIVVEMEDCGEQPCHTGLGVFEPN